MSLIRLTLQAIGSASRSGLQRVISSRSISQSVGRCSEQQQPKEEGEENLGEGNQEIDSGPAVDPRSDRSQRIPVETSIKYLGSEAYKQAYGEDPVWKHYRRNFKGQFAPRMTRKTCIRSQAIATTNPCPICRDEYLVLDHRNTDLINQFISPYNGEVISFRKTGLCQMQHRNLLVAIHRAKDFGTIAFDVPFKEYDYSDWYNPEDQSNKKQ